MKNGETSLRETFRRFVLTLEASGVAETVRAGQAAVNFSIDIINGVSLRHLADVLHVERLRPRPIKEEDREAGGCQQNKQRDLPAVTEKSVPAFLSRPKAGEELHFR